MAVIWHEMSSRNRVRARISPWVRLKRPLEKYPVQENRSVIGAQPEYDAKQQDVSGRERVIRGDQQKRQKALRDLIESRDRVAAVKDKRLLRKLEKRSPSILKTPGAQTEPQGKTQSRADHPAGGYSARTPRMVLCLPNSSLPSGHR